MFDTSQESPVKSPPVRMSESPTPCSGYDFHVERVTPRGGGPQAFEHLPCSPDPHSFAHTQAAHNPMSLSVHTGTDAVGLSRAALWTKVAPFNC